MKLNDVEDVFRPNNVKERVEPVDARKGNAIFTMRGNHDYMYDDIPATNRKESSGHACAKKEGNRYYIRMNGAGEIFNPLDIAHVNGAGRVKGDMPVWRYVKVTYTTFANYAHFLKTRNIAFLTLTRRDMGSGSV